MGAKLANVGVPLLLKQLVDAMTPGMNPATAALLVVPVGLLLAYGGLRLCTTLFTELRELVFAKATQGAARSIALETFQHLHALSLRFHLERQTGGMTRDIERGVRGIESLISYSLFSIVPTLIEVVLVLAILGVKFDMWFAWITIAALALYITYTVTVTESGYLSFDLQASFKPSLYIRTECGNPNSRVACSSSAFANDTSIKAQVNAGRRCQLYFFRDQQGLEVDFLVPGKGASVTLIEAKATRTATPEMTLPMQALAKAWRNRPGPTQDVRCRLVHRAARTPTGSRAIAPGVEAVTWQEFLPEILAHP